MNKEIFDECLADNRDKLENEFRENNEELFIKYCESEFALYCDEVKNEPKK